MILGNKMLRGRTMRLNDALYYFVPVIIGAIIGTVGFIVWVVY